MKTKYPYERVKDTETFIKRVKWNFGELYDYSKVDYINSKTEVEIICPTHGSFNMISEKHIAGQKCPECSKENSLSALRSNNPKPPKTSEWFIDKSREFHNNKYTYEKVSYNNMHTKVTITCPDHGDFLQTPNSHYRNGNGCPECAGMRSLSKSNADWFLTKAAEIHSDRYDYSLVRYETTNKKVSIVCREHGVFEQLPLAHLKGQNCPQCAGRNRPREEWIDMFKSVHGDTFDYSLFNYLGTDTKIKIICKKHGVFEQIIGNHLKYKHCCPDCLSEHRSSMWNLGEIHNVPHEMYTTDAPSSFYLLKIGEEIIKVGISCRIKERLQQLRRELQGESIEVLAVAYGKAREVYSEEQSILHKSGIPRILPDIEFSGKTECFSIEHLPKLKELFISSMLKMRPE